jgi:ketosteroid isomerase-like protein
MPILWRAIVGLLAVVAAGGAPAVAQRVEHPRDAAVLFEQATAAGDVDAIAALYAPGAQLLTPDGMAAGGRDAIRGIYARNQAVGPNSLRFHDVSFDEGPDRVTMLWKWTLTIAPPGKDVIAVDGRSLLYWKRVDGEWQIVLDMFQVIPPGR